MQAVATAEVGRSPSATSRNAVRSGWLLGSLTSTLLLAALALDLDAGAYRQLLFLAVAEALTLIGVLLTTRKPEQPISWGFAGTALLWAIGAVAYAYAAERFVAGGRSLPGALAAAWLDNWTWLPSIFLPISLLLLAVPDGRLPSSRWRVVVVAAVGGTAVASAGVSGSSTFEVGSSGPIDNPLAFDATTRQLLVTVGSALVAGAVLASLTSFVLRYRRSRGEERQQLRWVGGSLGVAALLGALGAVTWTVFPYAYGLYIIALLVVPAGTAVAIFKYRLYEVDLVVNRALVYGALTGCVVTSYVLVVGLIGARVSERANLVVSFALTAVVAVCFQPLRERVQKFVNHFMYGDRGDPYAALARLGRRLETSLQPEAVLPDVVETVGQTLRLQYAELAVETGTSGDHDVVATWGASHGPPLVFPLVHHGVEVGELRLAPRPGDRLREADRRLVADLSPHVATAVRAVRLGEELRSARRRVVQLREEERRRIRRDLHDGLGPSLAGVTFTLDAARNVAGSNLVRADALLASATDQLQAMIADVRRLIYGLRPPALDEVGLVGSLRALAARTAAPETRVDVEAPDELPPLPAAVEVAAYRIVQEALTNVARHARATSCRVRIALDPDALRVEVVDDGRGFSKDGRGLGLHTMRERAAELDGTCEIASAAGAGTRVTARLPTRDA